MNALMQHLGSAFDELPELLQRAHLGHTRLQGAVEVRRGRGPARWLGDLLGMPAAGDAVALTVVGHHETEQMHWHRDFAGRQMISCFRLAGDYLLEQMGPVRLFMKLRVEDGRLVYRLHHARVLGLPLPGPLAPKLIAFEAEENGSYLFKVEVRLPLFGLLVGYSGRLQLQ